MAAIAIFDVTSVLILACLAVLLWAVPPYQSLGLAWVCFAVAGVFVVAGRLLTDAGTGLDLAAAALLIGVALTIGRELVVTRAWPARAFVVAVATVTAAGAYQRAQRLDTIATSQDRPALQADAAYYQQQALKTFNPFAAGEKSPLWPALSAPLVRCVADRDLAIRLMSWAFGILMIPAVAVSIGRLFEPIVGIFVAGMLALNTWLCDLCTDGLREELGVCLWMAAFVLLFTRRDFSWARTLAAGAVSGVLLLLRNTDAPVLMVLVAYGLVRFPVHQFRDGRGGRDARPPETALIRGRAPLPRVLVGLLLPVAIVAPFYVNQYRTYGDAFHLEKRDARYHANFEFHGKAAPPGLCMPSDEAYGKDLYAGEPLSPAAYLFKCHSLRDVAAGQWLGLRQVVMGVPFAAEVSGWLQLACAVGIVATLVSARQRFAGLFVAGSVLGIRAHLIATMPSFELRLLLPVLVIWLAGGWWLIAAGVRAGMRRWVSFRQSLPHP